MKTVEKLSTLKEVLKEKKRISIVEASLLLGYSLEYFRKSVLPQLLVMSSCLKRVDDEIEWVCKEGGE